MPNPTPDFAQVRLSAAGQQLAGVSGLRISNGRRSFLFTGDAAQKIELSYEWRGVLSRKFTPSGDAMFEIVPDAATAATAGTGTPAAATPAAATSTATQPTAPAAQPATAKS